MLIITTSLRYKQGISIEEDKRIWGLLRLVMVLNYRKDHRAMLQQLRSAASALCILH